MADGRDPPMTVSRRSVLGAVLVAFLPVAGCSAIGRKGSVSVTIFNQTTARRAVQVRISREGNPLWEQRAYLPGDRDESSGTGGSRVVTDPALTGVPAGARLDVRAWLIPMGVDTDGRIPGSATGDLLVMDDLQREASPEITVRVMGAGDDAWAAVYV